MATPSNFYKNAAYSYRKQFKISSILDNLQGYNAATCHTDTGGEGGSLAPLPGVVSEGLPSGNKRRNISTLPENPLKILAKRQRQSGRRKGRREIPAADVAEPDSLTSAQAKPASVMGFDPYDPPTTTNPLALPYSEDEVSDDEVSQDDVSKGDVKDDVSRDNGAREGLSQGRDESREKDETEEQVHRQTSQHESAPPTPSLSSADDPKKSSVKNEDDDVIQWRQDQRFPAPDEPACVVCGRFGAYICDKTDMDVCSLECKEENLQTMAEQQQQQQHDESRHAQSPLNPAPPQPSQSGISFVALKAPPGALRLPEMEPERWDGYKAKWANRGSSLLTYVCWKCQCPGHFASECTRAMGVPAPSPANPTRYTIPLPSAHGKENGTVLYSQEMRAMYKRCQKIKQHARNARCLICERSSNLAHCLDCDRVFCDGKGHLTTHMREEPYHRRFFSHKLQRQVKCSKPDCPEDDLYALYSCPHCLSKAFDKHYDMHKATWSGAGLKMVFNCFCCEEHFDWHRYNCPNAGSAEGTTFVTRRGPELQKLELSEFLF